MLRPWSPTLAPVDWVAIGAIATILLAGATVWLGWQTRDVSRATGDLATRTTEELDLLRQQARASQEQVELQRQAQEDATREREEARRPLLAWLHGGSS